MSTENLVEKLLNEGKQLGRKQGRREGRQEGQAVGRRAALRRVLSARGLALDAADERRIEGCTRLDTLDLWLAQAVTARSAAEALRDG